MMQSDRETLSLDQKRQLVLQESGRLLGQQAKLRASIAQPLMHFLQSLLAKEIGCLCQLRLYGSLHHGLFVEGSSKVNIDITFLTGEDSLRDHLLQCLASLLQQRPDTLRIPALLRYPTLLLHKTNQRPIVLFFLWGHIPVHVTLENHAGFETSMIMSQGLASRGF